MENIKTKIINYVEQYIKNNKISLFIESTSDNDLLFDTANEISKKLSQDILLPEIKDYMVETKGHYYKSDIFSKLPERLLKHIENEMSYGVPNIDYFIISNILKGQQPNFKCLEDSRTKIYENECPSCGVRCHYRIDFINKKITPYTLQLDEQDNRNSFQVSKNCIKEGSDGSYSFIHSFPSGKIVFANDLRHILNKDDQSNDDEIYKKSGSSGINSDYGQELNAKLFSEKGLVYIQVGNTSPTIVFNETTKSIIAKDNYFYDENDEEISLIQEDEKELGYICTDLWAVCAMDYDLMYTLLKESKLKIHPEEEPFVEPGDYAELTVNVEPGDYKVTSFYSKEESNIFFTIEKI